MSALETIIMAAAFIFALAFAIYEAARFFRDLRRDD